MDKLNIAISQAQATIDAVENQGMSQIEAAITYGYDYESAKAALPRMLKLLRPAKGAAVQYRRAKGVYRRETVA